MRIWNYKKTRLIPYEPLKDETIAAVFRVGPSTPWFVAVIQLLDQYRDDILDSSINNVRINNPMAVSGSVVAADALKEAIDKLSELREQSMSKLT